MENKVDVLIIGSGPIGATYARVLSDSRKDLKIKMIDLGPKVSEKIGQHIKNIQNPQEVDKAQILSQGPKKEQYPMISVAERAAAVQRGELRSDYLARAGTHLVSETEDDLKLNQMPAVSLSTNLGGMGIHWTCACPRPGNEERIPFISTEEMDDALTKAEKVLDVTQEAFPISDEGKYILDNLNQALGKNHSPGRQVQPMPLACKNDNGNRYWTGPDVILGETLQNPNFEVISETLCKKILFEGDKITGVEVENITTGVKQLIEAKIVIVAADAIRTPQLLWASGIRPKALGHYLNEHPFIFTFVEMEGFNQEKAKAKNNKVGDPVVGVFWVPFDAPNHPFHGQIMHMDLSPMKTTITDPDKHIVGLGWGCLKESRFEDCIEFSETETDYFGMPKMSFKYSYSDKDKKALEEAKQMQARVASTFGKAIKDAEQTIMPAGSSLHYEGTTRMGEKNDGDSVCDSFSKVWEFTNLYVGGNGVIPMATTSNPTLTSVALAIRACENILKNDLE